MKALEFSRSEVKYAAANVVSRLRPGAGGKWGPLKLIDDEPPELPGAGWVRVAPRLSGICGSDLSTVDGHSSRYFEPYVSFPFTLGHEVVGDTEDGRRVVVEPVLGHEARGFPPPFEGAAPGDGNDYAHLVTGPLEPGIQIGFCESTGGGWSTDMVAHESQLHDVPEDVSDETAVLVEPTAVGVHAALRGRVAAGDVVAVLGAGTMGLTTLAALRKFTEADTLICAARYSVQRELADNLGADIVVAPDELGRAIRRVTGCMAVGDHLSGGADVVVDAVGNGASIVQSIGVCRPRGRVVLVGMPATERVNLTHLWHRETELVGAYTYGTEQLGGRSVRTFELAFELAAEAGLDRLLSATYPLSRYREAIVHAAEAGRRGAIKVAFDIRN